MFTFHHRCCLEDLQQICQVLLKDLRIVIERTLFAWLFRFVMEVQLNQLRACSPDERLLRCLKIHVQVRDQLLVIGERLLRCLKILVQVRDQILVIDKRPLRCVKILVQVTDWILRIGHSNLRYPRPRCEASLKGVLFLIEQDPIGVAKLSTFS